MAWTLFVLFLLTTASTLALIASGSGGVDQAFVVLATGYAVVGALVASRDPANAVGWLMLVIAVTFSFQGMVDAYLVEPGHPGAVAVAWVSNWAWYLWLYAAGMLLPLVFPDGQPLSRRWRAVLWLGVAALALAVISAALDDGRLDVESPVPIHNPLGLDGMAGDLVTAASWMSNVLAVTGFVLGGVSLVLRLRRSSGRVRQQVKWFVYTGGLALCGLLLAMAASIVEEAGDTNAPRWANVIGTIGWLSGLMLIVVGLPVTVGVAILRHRLYDIDLVIKRTLVYGSLSVLLAVTYLGLVLALRPALAPIAGDSDLAVAASTLTVAGLFRPVRGRIQQFVDRRFYRSRYDAARTIESFAGRLRQEVDLDAVSSDLRGVIHQTMQPMAVSLWLRSAR